MENTLNDYVNEIHYISHCNGKVSRRKMLQHHLFIEAEKVEDTCELYFPITVKLKIKCMI